MKGFSQYNCPNSVEWSGVASNESNCARRLWSRDGGMLSRSASSLRVRAKAASYQIFGAAGDDQFLSRGTQGREGEGFSIEHESGFGVIDCELRSDSCRRAILEHGAQVCHQLRTLKYNETVVERVAFVGFGKTGRDDAGNTFELQRRGRLLATGTASKIQAAHDDVAFLIERVEVRIVIFKCHRGHLLRRHVVAISVFAPVNAVGVQIVFVDEKNAAAHARREAGPDLDRPRRLRGALSAPNGSACRPLGEILLRAKESSQRA